MRLKNSWTYQEEAPADSRAYRRTSHRRSDEEGSAVLVCSIGRLLIAARGDRSMARVEAGVRKRQDEFAEIPKLMLGHDEFSRERCHSKQAHLKESVPSMLFSILRVQAPLPERSYMLTVVPIQGAGGHSQFPVSPSLQKE
jgi:hypothetical protein